MSTNVDMSIFPENAHKFVPQPRTFVALGFAEASKAIESNEYGEVLVLGNLGRDQFMALNELVGDEKIQLTGCSQFREEKAASPRELFDMVNNKHEQESLVVHLDFSMEDHYPDSVKLENLRQFFAICRTKCIESR